MYRQEYSVIFTLLLGWNHAHISSRPNIDANLEMGSRFDRASNSPGTPSALALKNNFTKANQLEEINKIFSDKGQLVSNVSNNSRPTGLWEGDDRINSNLTAKELRPNLEPNLAVTRAGPTSSPNRSTTTSIEIIETKQDTQDRPGEINNRPTTHHAVGNPGASEQIVLASVRDELDSTLATSSFTEDNRSSKIHARKGAENKKINARKGVDVDVLPSDDPAYTSSSTPIESSPKLISSHSETLNTSTTYTPYSVNNITNMATVTNKTDKFINIEPAKNMTVSVNSLIATKNISNTTQQIQVSNSKAMSTDFRNDTGPMPTISVGLDHVNDRPTSNNVSNSGAEGGIISSVPLLKKTPRPKPIITRDKSSDTPVSQERLPTQHDYVIPIVVSILAVPMVIVLLLYLYKKGSESWERRHYRRMDFLIDGMYND